MLTILRNIKISIFFGQLNLRKLLQPKYILHRYYEIPLSSSVSVS